MTALQITTPVGRIVQGHPFEYTDKDMQGNPLHDRNGHPRVKYFLALAIPKDSPEWPAVWGELCKAAQTGFPGGEFNRQDFAWKVVDGDTPEKSGKEGFAGHYVLNMANGYAPRVYTKNGEAQIVDKSQIKRGDYVRVHLTVTGNEQSAKPGLYLNHNMIELIGYGEEIQSGPDPRTVFGGAPAQVPPGASATPTAGGPPLTAPGAPAGPGGGQPPAPGGPAAPAAPGGATPPGQPAAPPAAGQPPAPGGPTAPAAPGAPATPAPAPTPQYVMTAAAGGWSREDLHRAGWTDQQLLEHGMMQSSAGSVTPAPDFLNPGQAQ